MAPTLAAPQATSISADRESFPVQGKIAAYCSEWGNLYMTIAQLRDKGIAQRIVRQSILNSELPDEVKNQVDDILDITYVQFAALTPEQIGEIVFTACVQQITGVRRQA